MKTIILFVSLLVSPIFGQSPPVAPAMTEADFVSITIEGDVIPGNQYCRVVWQDNSNNETGFFVEKAELVKIKGRLTWAEWSNQGWGLFVPNLNVLWDNPISVRKTYRYRVRAENEFGFSAWSNEIIVTR